MMLRKLSLMALLVGVAALSTSWVSTTVQTDSFTIVAFNTEWLFDGIDDNKAPWKSEEEANEHLQQVAAFLAQLDADFISLAEVEDDVMLGRLNALLEDAYTHIFVQGKDSSTGQDVCALTKVPPLDYGRTVARASYPVSGSSLTCGTGDTGVSKHYWTNLDIDDIPTTIIGVHFLAFPDYCQRAIKREAQATVIRELAIDKGLKAGREIILLGDFNDFDGAVRDSASNDPISIVLEILKDLDPESEGEELFNVSGLIPQEERYTCWYDRNSNGVDDGNAEHSQIDFILVTEGLYNRIDETSIDHSYAAGSVSDHWPVIVRFVYEKTDNKPDGNCTGPLGQAFDIRQPFP